MPELDIPAWLPAAIIVVGTVLLVGAMIWSCWDEFKSGGKN